MVPNYRQDSSVRREALSGAYRGRGNRNALNAAERWQCFIYLYVASRGVGDWERMRPKRGIPRAWHKLWPVESQCSVVKRQSTWWINWADVGYCKVSTILLPPHSTPQYLCREKCIIGLLNIIYNSELHLKTCKASQEFWINKNGLSAMAMYFPEFSKRSETIFGTKELNLCL